MFYHKIVYLESFLQCLISNDVKNMMMRNKIIMIYFNDKIEIIMVTGQHGGGARWL
jgi:hypothetical protein